MTITIDATSYRSPNHSPRPAGIAGYISAVVLHDGEGTKTSDLERLLDDSIPVKNRVSAHYYVDRDGNVYELVDPVLEAWHAGASDYHGRSNWNTFSIGVETEHKRGQNWPQVQKDALAELCRMNISRFGIKEQWIAAHKWIAKGRKFDPTDWPDSDLHMWINNLYVQPTHSIMGLTGEMSCGQGFYDFYNAHDGFNMFGYALTNEAKDIDSLGRECTWMRFERVVFKYVYGEGVHLCLLVEAVNKKWLL